jgi:hypothetical protein
MSGGAGVSGLTSSGGGSGSNSNLFSGSVASSGVDDNWVRDCVSPLPDFASSDLDDDLALSMMEADYAARQQVEQIHQQHLATKRKIRQQHKQRQHAQQQAHAHMTQQQVQLQALNNADSVHMQKMHHVHKHPQQHLFHALRFDPQCDSSDSGSSILPTLSPALSD